MPSTPANAINEATSGAVSFTGTAFNGGILSIANGGSNAGSFTQSNGIVTYNGTRLVNYAGPQISSSGVSTNTTQPSFCAYCNTTTSNNTGDGTIYTLLFQTVIFDQASNFSSNTTFTAPVTGKYQFNLCVLMQNCNTSHNPEIQIVTTGNTFTFGNNGSAFTGNNVLTGSVIAPMTANDTATAKLIVGNSTKTVGVYGAAGDPRTVFSGYLVC